MINYRYKIVSELGSGGSGTVLLVEDTLWNDRRCALKVLHDPPGTDASHADPYLAEVSALLSLRHPLLVTMYDFDTARQTPVPEYAGCRFFTMEYVEGSDALSWIGRLPVNDERARALNTLFAQCLSVLSYIHARSIVHSDIKPNNLLVSGAGTGSSPFAVKLSDFGFCRTGPLSDGAPARGTFEYAAPELLKGEATDERIDLYSLGAAFYHLVEGRCPFEADTPVALVKSILTEEPSFSELLWADVPELLTVVRSLLNKDPQERCGSAGEAAQLFGSDLYALTGVEIPHTVVVPFVGRESERQLLRTVTHGPGVAQDRAYPAAALVLGPEGIGKTRLVEEEVRAIRIGGGRVIPVTAGHEGTPYARVRQLLRAVEMETRSRAEAAGHPMPSKSRTVERILAGTDGLRVADRMATSEALARFVVECLACVPIVVVADDVESMDENSAEVLEKIGRGLAAGKGALIATASVNTLWPNSSGWLQRIPLPELTGDEILRLVVSVLGQGPGAEALGRKMGAAMGGMPAVVVEALRTILASADQVSIRENPESAAALMERSIPGDADRLWFQRFSSLSREQQSIVLILSCCEYAARIDTLDTLLPFHPERTRWFIRDMDHGGVLQLSDENRRVAIRSHNLKRVVYDSLGADRAVIHRLILRGMADSRGASSIQELTELGYQSAGAGDREGASVFFERAGAGTVELRAYSRASALFARAADAAAASSNAEREIALRARQAEALLQSGMAMEALDLALGVMRRGNLPEHVRHSLLRTTSLARSRLGEFESAKEGLRGLINGAADEGERAELVQELVNIEINMGGFQKAEVTCREQLPVAERLGDEQLKGAIYTDLGVATFLQGRFDDAARCFQEALRTYERLNDESHVTTSLNNIGNAMSARGDPAAAIAQWRRALEHAAVCGSMDQEAKIQNNLGIAYFNLRQYDAARSCYTLSRELFRRLGAKKELAYTLTNLGEVTFAEGEYGGALEAWTDAWALYTEMSDTRGLAETSLQLAGLRITVGDHAGAEGLLRDAQEHIERDGIEPLKGPLTYWKGMRAAAAGTLPPALTLLGKADEIFQAGGEQQQSFLCHVKMAECLFRSGSLREASEKLKRLLALPEADCAPLVRAEARYLSGLIERQAPGATGQLPLVHFKAGMDLQQQEPIGEVTWKLTCAMAEEFWRRSQPDRARPFLLQTEAVLNHFVSCLPSEELRAAYLGAEGRAQVLSEVSRLCPSRDAQPAASPA